MGNLCFKVTIKEKDSLESTRDFGEVWVVHGLHLRRGICLKPSAPLYFKQELTSSSFLGWGVGSMIV